MDYELKYLKYKNKYKKLNQKIMLGGKKSKNTLYLFKAEWCGHCIGFKQTWTQLQKDFKNKINFISYDADQDTEIMKNYNIQGYPTLIMQQNDKAIEYVGNRNIDSLKEFINTYN